MRKYLDSGAQISPCEKYRFSLWRIWDEALPQCAFVGLNPSTADATKYDPTIRRCCGFAMSHGYGGLTMLNLWAYRSKNPVDLSGRITNEEKINEDAIVRVASNVSRVVAAWGSHAMAFARQEKIMAMVPEWWALHITKSGMPGHPLYLKATSQMRRFP